MRLGPTCNWMAGVWQQAFDKSYTHSEDFHCLDGSTMQVQMMFQEDEWALTELADLDVRAVKMPFKDSE